jgi:carotenoid cleavage dioxygenase-like enzyme
MDAWPIATVGCARSSGRSNARPALFGASGDPRDGSGSRGALDGVANTHIVSHGGKLLALEEGHGPIEIDPRSLDTIGPWTFDHQLPGAAAHLKIDPITGEMLFFANFPSRAFTGESFSSPTRGSIASSIHAGRFRRWCTTSRSPTTT